jgi:hypothetical protein
MSLAICINIPRLRPETHSRSRTPWPNRFTIPVIKPSSNRDGGAGHGTCNKSICTTMRTGPLRRPCLWDGAVANWLVSNEPVATERGTALAADRASIT